ncbi:TetR/AcrR family transcriptional regulator [Aldersonia sp. NBC_00410]|uniref:TetR/AcrR family transcriptional regulator n=1 Tax=Aldersonia sp. NBC_00410 TaxID=2975954 RepID=UPI00224CABFE|nr:TetR family transcriptional regulator [Aldersonia sp. NBC_00410]MCX5044404.1 TetR/AcrR family transcriptional regulator [Aldersonia sp. NBC_00410]
MRPAGTGTYRGVSAEQRREQRRRRLLDAGMDIIATQGWAATTVRGVCEQAKVGPRFFYESFDDLDTLAAAVHDEIVESALGRALDAVASADQDPHSRLTAGIGTIIVELTEDPRRARVAFAEAHGSETLMRRRFTAMRTIAQVVRQQTEQFVELPDSPTGSAKGEAVLQAFAQLLTGGVAEVVLVWLDGGLDMNRDELVQTCVEFTLTMLDRLPEMANRVGDRLDTPAG